MIRIALFDPSSNSLLQGGEELLARWRSANDMQLWIDIEAEPADREVALLASFGAHPRAIEDALKLRHPPRFEAFEGISFLLLRGLDAKTRSIDFGVIQLGVFLGDRFVITRHHQASTSANALYAELAENPELLGQGGGSIVVRLWTLLGRRYVQILLDLEPRLEEMEQDIFERPDDSLLEELTRYKSRLREITRIARYHQDVLAAFQDSEHRLHQNISVHDLNYLNAQTERTRSLSELYYEFARDLTDGYLAISSHRLNGVMRILTIITVLFVPLTFIAGIYGMNFNYIPELKSDYGYFVVIGLMLILAAVQLFVFRKRGWL